MPPSCISCDSGGLKKACSGAGHEKKEKKRKMRRSRADCVGSVTIPSTLRRPPHGIVANVIVVRHAVIEVEMKGGIASRVPTAWV